MGAPGVSAPIHPPASMSADGRAAGLSRRMRACCAIALVVATAAAATNAVWQPGAPAMATKIRTAQHEMPVKPVKIRTTDDSSGPAAGDTMRCIGDGDVDRACLVRDLYYDTTTRTFTWHGATILPSEGSAPVEANADTFERAMWHIDKATAPNEFSVRWSPQAPPDAAEACVISVPLHLRREAPLGTESLGHLLRDNFYFLVWIAERFGEDPAAWSWVTWPRARGPLSNVPAIALAMPKIGMLVSHRKSRRWFEIEASCKNGQNELGPDVAGSAPRYILLRRALMSGASSRKWATNEKAHACKAARFDAMRDHALRINSIAPRPPPRPTDRILMSFLLKPDTDKRQLLVPPAVLVAIRNGFPQIDVELHTAMLEDEVVQLDWLSRTDILVTNVGSASFRMIYLPDGAQVIMAGPLERDYEDEDGYVSKASAGGPLWRELRQCWDDVAHLDVHRYHVTSGKDIVLKPMDDSRARGRSKQVRAGVRIRDADVILRREPLLAAVRKAVAKLQTQATSRLQAPVLREE